MKFGGAAVASAERFAKIVDIIIDRKKEYSRIAVVVSAMANTTDTLIELARQVHPTPPRREYDMLVSVGERISISLLAMALSLRNQEAISFTGSQSGIITSEEHTEARILEVKPHRLLPHLEKGKIVIVAGFQGVSTKGEITTLGRGGSDTSAVALGVALDAEKVEFFKDVAGIYPVDPKKDPTARPFETLTHDEAFEIASQGAKVLHPRSIELARMNHLPLHVLPFEGWDTGALGTRIGVEKQSIQPCYEKVLV
jgi:aspartate kinase